MSGRSLAKLVFVGGIVFWIANAILHCSTAPLGHDEARYAGDTRGLLHGEGKRYVYVPVGMNALAAPGVLAGGDERALRAISLLAGIAFLLGAWTLARRATTDDTAAWTVGVLAGALPMIRFSSDLLSDLPSAACLLFALAILVVELRRDDGPSFRLVGVAPLCAASFYIRYGSCLSIMVIAIGAVIIGGRRMLRRPAPVLVTVALLAAFVVPHVVWAMKLTGSPIGILVISAEVPGHVGEGLVDYVSKNPFVMYGHLVALLMVVGLAPIHRNRTIIALQVIAVGQVVALGLTTFAQPRFIFLATVLLVIVGVMTIQRFINISAPKIRPWLAGVCAIGVAVLWVGCLYDSVYARDGRIRANAPAIVAARAIRNDAGGTACTVVAHRSAQISWYSGCRQEQYVPTTSIAEGARVYGVRERRGRTDAEVSEAPVARCLVLAVPSVVEVLRLAPADTRCVTAR